MIMETGGGFIQYTTGSLLFLAIFAGNLFALAVADYWRHFARLFPFIFWLKTWRSRPRRFDRGFVFAWSRRLLPRRA